MNHEYFMRMAFELALKGLGHTSPNPMSGAVLVRDNIVIGSGYHQKYGGNQAELNAILDAKAKGFKVEGATLYCNLQSAASAQLIVQEKISQVVICNTDPDPKNLGLEILNSDNIDVITGVNARDGLILNEVYFKFITTNLPFIHVLGNGFLDSDLRQKYDCVVVDRKTVELHNPSLTSDSNEFEKKSHPLRLVVGALHDLNPNWKILSDEFKRNTMMVATDDEVRDHPEVVRFLESIGVALLSVRKTNKGQVDLKAMLKSLASLKLTSLLVEGGDALVAEFLKEGLVDKVD